jgi:hypothetical protein
MIVLYLSKHGSTCNKGTDQYPEVPVGAKQQFWAQIVAQFGSLLVDHSQVRINADTINDMLQLGQRVVVYAADYIEFTNSSKYALNACLDDQAPGGLQNTGGPGAFDVPDEIAYQESTYRDSAATNAQLKTRKAFSLLHTATAVMPTATEYAAAIRYLPNMDWEVRKCANTYAIPEFAFCPPTLLDIGQLHNYYNQLMLEKSHTNEWGFPNAIYTDAIDSHGTIRTGA